jgi:hypothetical protein
LKRVKKYKCEISKDPDTSKFFYDKMYAPHIMRKYVVSDEFIYLEKFFRNGELLFVTLDGKRVCASLCGMRNDNYFSNRTAALDEDSVREGAMVAAFYFSILRAKELNAKAFHFGTSRPFLLDGVLRHKNSWGTKICESDLSKRFIYLRNVSFVQPFIYIEDKKLKIAIFSEDDKLIKEYANSGLDFNVIHML